MARCACGNLACACVIQAAPDSGIVVVGNGSPTRPYQIGQAGGGNPLLNLDVLDDPSLDLAISGTGTATDKRIITGKAKPSMRELRDVDAADVPANGDVVTWNSTLSKWVFAPAAGGGNVPIGGTVGQVLTKLSSTDGDASWRPSPFVQELGAGVNLDTVTTTGVYTQSQDAEAAGGTNYPIAKAGLLEVISNTSGSAMTWQRYTVYSGAGVGAGAIFERGLYVSTWQPWKQVGGFYSDYAICTAGVILSTAGNTDITGMALTVPVPGPSSVFEVKMVFDVNTQAATANTFVGQLSAGGTTLTQQAIWVPTTGVLTGGRQMLSQNHRITGLANGNQVFKALASCSVANQFRINASHSTIAVTQIA